MSEDRSFPLPPPPRRSQSQHSERIGEGVGAALRIVGILAAVMFVLFWCSGITVVQPSEVALVMRFGKLLGDTPAAQVHPPGMLLAWPYPIDQVVRIPAKEEREIAIDQLQLASSAGSGDELDPIRDGYVLCGDQHILQTSVRVKFRITDPAAYHFHSHRPERILQEIVCASIVQTIGRWNAMDTLRLQRSQEGDIVEQLPLLVMTDAQTRLDQLDLGIGLTAIEFREIRPTQQLAAAFENVQSEQINIETRKREAEGFATRTLPRAEADRYTLVNEAVRFQTSRVTSAQEEVALFDKIHAQYRRNPNLVWNRLYLESMEHLMRSSGQFRFVSPGTRLVVTPPSHQSGSPMPAPLPPQALSPQALSLPDPALPAESSPEDTSR